MTRGLAALLAVLALPLRAQEAGDDQRELDALLGVIAEETDIATRTRQNADFVPGIVSVLRGDELAVLGARTVLDGLALVPGIEINRDAQGSATLRVRGIDFFFNSGNVKVLVNSLPVSREATAKNAAILLMPIEQVERIEVIRGPGAGLYGDYAFTGLVNIVTATDRNGLNLGAGSGDKRTYGARASAGDDDDAWRFDGSASALRSSRYDFPDRVAADEDRRYAALELGRGALVLKAVAADRDERAVVPVVSPRPGAPTTRRADAREINHIVELRYTAAPAPAWRVETWASYLATEAEQINLAFEGARAELGAQAQWDGASQHLLAQATVARPRIDHARLVQPPNQAPGPVGPIDIRGDEHDTFSLSVQDQLELGGGVSVTGGLRYDRFEDLDARVSPRLAALWRIGERHSLKAQYAEGFRTPTFVESYSGGTFNRGLDYETIASTELEYLYRDARTAFRATAYRERAADLIQPRQGPGARGHENRSELTASGVELELTRQLTPWLKAMATYSKGHTDDGRGERPDGRRVDSFGKADALANIALIARPADAWDIGVHLNHVGSRAAGESRDADGYDVVDAAVTHRFDRVKGLSLRVGVHNLFDAEVTHLLAQPNNPRLLDYGGRLWTATLDLEF